MKKEEALKKWNEKLNGAIEDKQATIKTRDSLLSTQAFIQCSLISEFIKDLTVLEVESKANNCNISAVSNCVPSEKIKWLDNMMAAEKNLLGVIRAKQWERLESKAQAVEESIRLYKEHCCYRGLACCCRRFPNCLTVNL